MIIGIKVLLTCSKTHLTENVSNPRLEIDSEKVETNRYSIKEK